VRDHFEDHESECIAVAVAPYERERVTPGDATRLADVDRWPMQEILREHGVALRLGLVVEGDATYEKDGERTRIQ
jgi:predicted HTH domain antitoxin